MIHILTQAYHCPPYRTPQEPLCCRPPHENNCTIINPTAPYKLHPVTTASTGEGREMADKLLDLGCLEPKRGRVWRAELGRGV